MFSEFKSNEVLNNHRSGWRLFVTCHVSHRFHPRKGSYYYCAERRCFVPKQRTTEHRWVLLPSASNEKLLFIHFPLREHTVAVWQLSCYSRQTRFSSQPLAHPPHLYFFMDTRHRRSHKPPCHSRLVWSWGNYLWVKKWNPIPYTTAGLQ